jgi:branched-chain amino acid transport system permease protein
MSDASNIPTRNLAPSNSAKFRQRVLPFIVMAAIFAIIPLFGPSRTMLSLFNAMGTFMVFALSYNMLLGRAGLLSFGHAVYFGIGGYFCVHAMSWIENAETGIWANYPVFFLPIIGFAGGALAGAIVGWPSCRRAGTPCAMISLGVAELIAAAAFMFSSLSGGEMGISGDRMNGPQLFGLSMGPAIDVYWFVAFWTVVATALMYAFTRTPLGKMSEATRDNPERVQFVGYNPFRVRYMVFMFAGGFAGLAGGMSAVNYEIFTPEALSLGPSGLVLLMAYIGGIRYFAGPLLGAIVLTYMQSNLSDFSEAWLLYLGILFISIVMFAPDGLAGIIANFIRGTKAQGWIFLKRWSIGAAGILIAMIGVITLVESAVLASNGFGEVFEPFGLVHLKMSNPLTWILSLFPMAIGIVLVRHMAKLSEEA